MSIIKLRHINKYKKHIPKTNKLVYKKLTVSAFLSGIDLTTSSFDAFFRDGLTNV
jgi:hypothetical protein